MDRRTTKRSSHAKRGDSGPGQLILDQSFRLIDQELGPLDLPPWAVAVVRRMIHASADFDFARNIRFHPDFHTAFSEAIRQRLPIITDVEMVRIGIQTQLQTAGLPPAYCFIGHEETRILAEAEGLTRSAAAMRIAARNSVRSNSIPSDSVRSDSVRSSAFRRPILIIGNAPTALEEALNLAESNDWRPAAILAIPVGFVGVTEAKQRLLAQTLIPHLTSTGPKGGSAVTAAAANALIDLKKSPAG